MTQRTRFDEMSCTIARTLDVIGEWWTPLILRDILVGLTRFDAIQEDLGISRKVLAERLDRLVEQGIVRRVPYQERPPRYDYVPTEMGAELGPVLLAMQAWGDRWLDGEPPVLVRHTTCGKHTTAVTCCAECGEPLRAGEVVVEPGPGLEDAEGGAAAAVLRRLAAARGSAVE